MISIRVSPVILLCLVVLSVLFNALQGLAGWISYSLVFFPLFLVIVAGVQLIVTYSFFGFHEDFSTDHPVRGQPVLYSLAVHYRGVIPSSLVQCHFTFTGPGLAGNQDFALFASPNQSFTRTFEFRCAYWGVYAVGVQSFVFKDILGLFSLIYHVEPRMFYVYPELLPLGPGLEDLITSSGQKSILYGGKQDDSAVFEYVYPLRDGEGSRHIAWKRFASTGIPCAFHEGKSQTQSLRVVLDLRWNRPDVQLEEILIAEDLAISLAFSIVYTVQQQKIPVEFVSGGDDQGYLIEQQDAFEYVYALSTGIHFNERNFPQAAFTGDLTTLLITCSALVDTSTSDAFDALSLVEERILRGYKVVMIVVPPPSMVEEEQERIQPFLEHIEDVAQCVPCRILDTRQGTEGVEHVFS